jgi:CRP-like cAMP-binding protein
MFEGRGNVTRELFLRSFFGGAVSPSPWLLSRIAPLLEAGEIGEGEVLFREGETPDRIYFVEDGLFRLTREGASPFRYRGRWILGGVDVMAGRPRHRTATALRATSLVSVRGADWLDAMEDTFDVARDVVTMQSGFTARLYAKLREPFPAARPTTQPPARSLSLFDRLLVFFDAPVLRKAGVQTLSILAEVTEEIRLAQGELLIDREARRDRIFLVAHGRIDTTHPGQFGRAGFVGGASFLVPGWEARAAMPSVVLALPVEDWFDTMEEHFDLVRCAMAWNALERERIYESLADQEPEPTFE